GSAGAQACDDAQGAAGDGAGENGVVEALRNEEVGAGERGRFEIAGEDADDADGQAVEGDGAIENGRAAAVARLPEGVRNEGGAGRVGGVFGGGKGSAERGLDAEGGEEGGFGGGATEADGFAFGEVAIIDAGPRGDGLQVRGQIAAEREVAGAEHEIVGEDGGLDAD